MSATAKPQDAVALLKKDHPVVAFLARDALIPAIWLGAWMRSAIVWRGNAMDVRPRRAAGARSYAPTA